MTNLLDEIEEDLRKDRLKRLWDRYGVLIIGLAVLFVAAIAGWRGYVGYQQSQAAATGDRWQSAIQVSTTGNHADAVQAFERLAREGTGGYPILARFRLAAERHMADDTEGAIRAFDELAADTGVSALWRDLARIRAAILLVDLRPAEVAQRVEGLAVAQGAFRHTARELMGLATFRAGDAPGAVRWFEQAITDAEAPEGLRQRAGLILTILAADGVTPRQATR